MFLVPVAVGGSLYYAKKKKNGEDDGVQQPEGGNNDDVEIIEQDDVHNYNDLENSQFSEQTPITFTEENDGGEDGFMIIESPTSRSTASTSVGAASAATTPSLASSSSKEKEELMSSIDEKIEKEIQARKERENSKSKSSTSQKGALAEVCQLFTDPYPEAFMPPPTIPTMPQSEKESSTPTMKGLRLKPRKQQQRQDEGEDKIPVNIAFGKFAAFAGSTVVNMIKDPLAQNTGNHNQNP
mmetsp:Transcript_3675/g.5295  ORF Transcript_3675/g.5295 Transcript_3675/m.5295 type:complete len:240 (+) Transcript_3675:106-825(+)